MKKYFTNPKSPAGFLGLAGLVLIPEAQEPGLSIFPFWVWLVIFLVILILFLWWLFSGGKKGVPAGIKEDLAIIEGIGPKIGKMLQAAGINTFADLAKTDIEKIKGLLKDAGLAADPTTWPKQAKLAAEGKMEELKKLQDELTGGH
jgi:hypothetical protein